MDCEELEKHLADCPPCVAFIQTLRRTSSLFGEHCAQEKVPPEVAVRLRERLQALYRSSAGWENPTQERMVDG